MVGWALGIGLLLKFSSHGECSPSTPRPGSTPGGKGYFPVFIRALVVSLGPLGSGCCEPDRSGGRFWPNWELTGGGSSSSQGPAVGPWLQLPQTFLSFPSSLFLLGRSLLVFVWGLVPHQSIGGQMSALCPWSRGRGPWLLEDWHICSEQPPSLAGAISRSAGAVREARVIALWWAPLTLSTCIIGSFHLYLAALVPSL